MAAMLRPLPDYLAPGLNVIFAGANPGVISSRQGHYYANPANAFWKLLRAAKLIPDDFGPTDDRRAREFGIGLTDLVKRPTPGVQDLSTEEKRAGATRLRKKLELYRPLVVCFNGKEPYRGFFGHDCEPGLQRNERIGGARVFVMPSTSPQNTRWSFEDKLRFVRNLKRAIADERRRRG